MSTRLVRHKRIRKKIFGTSSVPRVSIYRSNKHLMVQLINDDEKITICGMSTRGLNLRGTKTEKARELGVLFAKKVLSIDNGRYKKVVFDRGGYKYHGRVKAFAEALRDNGLVF